MRLPVRYLLNWEWSSHAYSLSDIIVLQGLFFCVFCGVAIGTSWMKWRFRPTVPPDYRILVKRRSGQGWVTITLVSAFYHDKRIRTTRCVLHGASAFSRPSSGRDLGFPDRVCFVLWIDTTHPRAGTGRTLVCRVGTWKRSVNRDGITGSLLILSIGYIPCCMFEKHDSTRWIYKILSLEATS